MSGPVKNTPNQEKGESGKPAQIGRISLTGFSGPPINLADYAPGYYEQVTQRRLSEERHDALMALNLNNIGMHYYSEDWPDHNASTGGIVAGARLIDSMFAEEELGGRPVIDDAESTNSWSAVPSAASSSSSTKSNSSSGAFSPPRRSSLPRQNSAITPDRPPLPPPPSSALSVFSRLRHSGEKKSDDDLPLESSSPPSNDREASETLPGRNLETLLRDAQLDHHQRSEASRNHERPTRGAPQGRRHPALLKDRLQQKKF